MPATEAQRKAEKSYIQRLKDQGLVARKYWVTPEEHEKLKKYLDELRADDRKRDPENYSEGMEYHGQEWTQSELVRIVRASQKHVGKRVYFLVPKAEKDTAKAQGARWDSDAVGWYWDVPVSDDTYRQWLSLSDALKR